MFSPPQVLAPYDPSDGVSASAGDVLIRNALVVAADAHRPGVLSAFISNTGDRPALITVSDGSGAPPFGSVTVAPGQRVTVGSTSNDSDDRSLPSPAGGSIEAAPPEPAWVQLPDVPVLPGLTIPLTFTIDGHRVPVDNVPVKLPCFAYRTLRPTPPAGATGSASTPQPVQCQPTTGEVGPDA